MNVRTLAGLGVVAASLVVSASSRADFLGATIVEVTADVGTPEGFVTYRIVANFDRMDVVLAWGGIPGEGQIVFYTGNEVDLLNDADSPFFSLKQDDFAHAPISADWDSWVTVGATEHKGNNTDYSDGFLGSDGVHAVIVGSSFQGEGLVFNGNPGLPKFGLDVAIAQFTIPGVPGGGPGDPGHNGFHLEGVIAWNPPGAGDFIVSSFMVDNIIPAPGGLALLGLIGLAGPRRRRAWN